MYLRNICRYGTNAYDTLESIPYPKAGYQAFVPRHFLFYYHIFVYMG